MSWDREKSRYAEEQIAFAVKHVEKGMPVAKVQKRLLSA